MLKIEVGDVFNALLAMQEKGKSVVFAHGCNAQGVMGAGVAALVKKLYPYAFTAYKAEDADFGLVLGDVVYATNESNKVVVANAITQQNYGRDGKLYASYDAIVDSMSNIAKYAKKHNVPVYLPLIGGGLGGGGDEKRLKAIFEAVFHDVDATLFVQD